VFVGCASWYRYAWLAGSLLLALGSGAAAWQAAACVAHPVLWPQGVSWALGCALCSRRAWRAGSSLLVMESGAVAWQSAHVCAARPLWIPDVSWVSGSAALSSQVAGERPVLCLVVRLCAASAAFSLQVWVCRLATFSWQLSRLPVRPTRLS
jgi:hypothetical protein